MYLLKKDAAATVMLFLGGTGLGPSTTISKNGGSFASSANVAAEVASGWYSLLLDTSETDTAGALAIHTNAGTPSDFLFQVGAEVDANLVRWLGAAPLGLTSQFVQVHAAEMAAGVIDAAALNVDVVAKLFSTVALTESYAADGATGTPTQLLYGILQALTEFSISGATLTVKKLDGTTTAMTFTLAPSGNPLSRTRAT